MDAFDADVLIYAASPEHELGSRVRSLIPDGTEIDDEVELIGSIVLVPELLSQPLRLGRQNEVDALLRLLSRIELRPVDDTVGWLAGSLGAHYKLRAADSLHLATAVNAGADRFITNDHAAFPRDIAEIQVTYPIDLADP